MKYLKLAEDLAKALGDGNTLASIRAARTCNSLRYGLTPPSDPQTLISSADLDDDVYSRSALTLELARLALLQGDPDQAYEYLNQACPLVHKSAHRRQEILLNLLFASYCDARGQTAEALNYVKNASAALDPGVDAALISHASGLWKKLNNDESLPMPVAGGHSNGYLNERITTRLPGKQKTWGTGEDPVGEILDLINRCVPSAENSARILRSGYFSLFIKQFGLDPRGKYLLIDVVPNAVIAVDRGQVLISTEALSSTLRTFVYCLAENPQSKERLVDRIWGYKYHPDRHDVLIYQAVSRIRQNLGTRKYWLENTESGYGLASDLVVRRISYPSPTTGIVKFAANKVDQPDGLTFRHETILNFTRDKVSVSVHECRRLLNVSEATANRELRSMMNTGLLERVGMGRATHYIISERRQNS